MRDAALLETRRRMEREPLDDKFMPGLADRFVAENPCPTSYRSARPKRTSTTMLGSSCGPAAKSSLTHVG